MKVAAHHNWEAPPYIKVIVQPFSFSNITTLPLGIQVQRNTGYCADSCALTVVSCLLSVVWPQQQTTNNQQQSLIRVLSIEKNEAATI